MTPTTPHSERSSHRSPDLRALALAVIQPGFVGLTPPDWLRRELELGLGGVALFARNIDSADQVAELNAAIHAENPRALVAIDEEAGDVTRMEHSTGSSWPGNLALGTLDDVALTEAAAREIGVMLDAVGVDLDYAPVADINDNPDNPVIGVRSFGSDPEVVARHTAAWVRGLQSAGVLACAKHFPGHGDTSVDSHLGLPEVDFVGPNDAVLQPFQAAIDAGVGSIMTAHIIVRGLDDQPSTLSHKVLVDLLRGSLGFRGLVLSDGMEMGGITGLMSLPEGCVRAVGAGVDLLCIGGGLADETTVLDVADALVEAVHDGRLEESRLAEAAAASARAADERVRLRGLAASVAPPQSHNAAGSEAARRAVVVNGPVHKVARAQAPTVVELAAPTNIAAGDETRRGIAAAVARRWPGTPTTVVNSERELLDSVAQAGERPVWVCVRDPHRHDWMVPALAALLSARPDAVVIETGWPAWTAPAGTTHVVTHGAAGVTAEHVVDLLA
jgi:beta-N-acetylhexosaminidase